MPKRNVLILNHSYKSPFKELDVQYAKLFHPDRFTVTMAYLTGGADSEEVVFSSPYDTIFLNLRKKDIRRFKVRAIRKVRALCEERNITVSICHRYKPTYIMAWVARSCRIPYLISVMHDFRTLNRLSHKLFVYWRLRHQFVFAGVSDAVRDDIYRDGWGLRRDQVITLPNSIDLPETEARQLDRETARRQLNLPEDAFVLGTVGRLHPAKDHLTLINAMALAACGRPGIRLVIIGNGPLEESLQEEIQRHRLDNHIKLTGFIPEASRLMRAFDVYVSSSGKEPFGMVLLEAMAAGLPIIATAVDGVPQVMGDCGCLVPAGDAQTLAEAITAYSKKPSSELFDLGRVSRQRLQDNYTTEHFRDTFWELFSARGLLP